MLLENQNLINCGPTVYTKTPRIRPILIPAARALRDSARPRTYYVINMNL